MMKDKEDRRRRWRDRGESGQRRTEKEDDKRRGEIAAGTAPERKTGRGKTTGWLIAVQSWFLIGRGPYDMTVLISLGLNSAFV